MSAGHARWAVINRIGNPFLRALLRSPAHRLASGNLALITVTGRRSGREYTFPVGYSREGDLVTITVGWADQKQWWRNLRGEGAPVGLRIDGRERTGHARAGGDESGGVTVSVRLDPA